MSIEISIDVSIAISITMSTESRTEPRPFGWRFDLQIDTDGSYSGLPESIHTNSSLIATERWRHSIAGTH